MPKGRAIFQLSLRQLALVAFIALNLAIPRETQAEWLAGAGTGLNICVPDRKANCRGYLPHAALDLSLGYQGD